MGVGVVSMTAGSSGSAFVVSRHLSMMSLESVVNTVTVWEQERVSM